MNRTLVVAVSLLLAAPLCGAELPPDIREQWLRARRAEESLSCRIESRSVWTRNGKTESDRTFHYEIRRIEGYFFCRLGYERNGHRYDNVSGQNPEYEFKIHTGEFAPDKPPNTLPWSLTESKVFPERRSHAGYRKAENTFALRYANPTLKLFDYTLDELGDYTYFKPGKVSPVPGSHLVRVDFEYVFTNPGETLHRTGWLHLDPTNCWVVAESEWTEPRMGKEHHTFEFQPSGTNGYRPCRRWKHVHEYINGPTEEEVATYEPLPSDLRPEECYLAYYNLPEPVEASPPQPTETPSPQLPPRGTPRYVWWLVGAGVFALLAVLFWRINRRRGGRSLNTQTVPPITEPS
jgi:hypothetical protein